MVDLVFAFCRRSQSRICGDQPNDITVIHTQSGYSVGKCGQNVGTGWDNTHLAPPVPDLIHPPDGLVGRIPVIAGSRG